MIERLLTRGGDCGVDGGGVGVVSGGGDDVSGVGNGGDNIPGDHS